jgi:hypothetical protein
MELLAQTFNLIVCSGTDADPCTFAHLVLATMAFAYAGFILLTSGGSEGKKDEAKKIFTKVLIGYLWILGAWLLVYTITSVLLNSGYSVLGAP